MENQRENIGRVLRQLREARRWSQEQLADRLATSQSSLSQIERGLASLTAEQFIEVLRLFNVSTHTFLPEDEGVVDSRAGQVQNALARWGARHLRVDPRIIPDERADLHATIAEALNVGDARTITAIAPVLVANAGEINFAKLSVDADRSGRRQRLYWIVDNTLEAVRGELRTASLAAAPHYRRAIRELGFVMKMAEGYLPTMDDVLEPGIRSVASVERLKERIPAIAQKWHVISTLQVEDFAAALRESYAR
jgi:transcriptional regulator with XRE-family HTH domain